MTTIAHRLADELSVQNFVPRGWPETVLPPGVPDWEQSAADWLLGCCPPDYRGYAVLRRHPSVLARFAGDFIEGRIRANREMRLDDQPSLLDDEAEELRLLTVRKAIALVEEALRGKVFIRAVRN